MIAKHSIVPLYASLTLSPLHRFPFIHGVLSDESDRHTPLF